MPSPKSREFGFYYSHPQNRFWRIISELAGWPLPETKQEKEALLTYLHIALWDVLYACRIKGADDSSIREPVVNDINQILDAAPIEQIFTTGKKATQLYQKYCFPITKRAAVELPSTSPANCRYYCYNQLKKAYEKVFFCCNLPLFKLTKKNDMIHGKRNKGDIEK